MNKRKSIIKPLVLIIILSGTMISNSELENTRGVDIAKLIILGVLIGIQIANLKTTFSNK